MKLVHADVEAFITQEIQPKVRVDGGNVELERIVGTDVHIGAHSECSTCSAMAGCMKGWLETRMKRVFGDECRVIMHSRRPYYKRCPPHTPALPLWPTKTSSVEACL
ncbi:MAG: NifU family protein [Lentisphaerae bacterium]|jgi:Fe-S cluster biogenesis protein NfuA|nr:NifU family protein [Lentisphaerota bacterium]MBT4819507.1 NifU family protein [Lentisphaerota bacterium]MBT5610079.1 NifU family protein [Lentisphaerota bacterium]MBT7059807.1 NifU family protein [Lentisphaerota bacterium]MBT7847248.1 NifU family protein [Lentisphaerota bacterium]